MIGVNLKQMAVLWSQLIGKFSANPFRFGGEVEEDSVPPFNLGGYLSGAEIGQVHKVALGTFEHRNSLKLVPGGGV